MILLRGLSQLASKSSKDEAEKALSVLKNRVEANKCPTASCNYVRAEILTVTAEIASDLLREIDILSESYNVDAEFKREMAVIITRYLIQASTASAQKSIEMCQACMTSSLLSDGDIQ